MNINLCLTGFFETEVICNDHDDSSPTDNKHTCSCYFHGPKWKTYSLISGKTTIIIKSSIKDDISS